MIEKKVIVTGGAGSIGANLVSRLLESGHKVLVVDDFSLGRPENLNKHINSPKLCVKKLDITDLISFESIVNEFAENSTIDEVWHLAANSDIQAGVADPSVDLNKTFLTTTNTLSIMKMFSIPAIVFASTSAVYGDLGGKAASELYGPLLPISNYGAMKLASEAAISAATSSYVKSALIVRFPNVVGIPATHGVIHDFFNKLDKTPNVLEVLGDGFQQKSYLHIDELLDAMFMLKDNQSDVISLCNVGPTDSGVTVKFIAENVVSTYSPNAAIKYGKNDRGWVGDVPKFSYDISKILQIGWSPKLSSAEAVQLTIRQIANARTNS